jgi:ABC-2 type transport system permease protein
LSEYDVPGRGHGVLDVFRWRYLLSVLIRKGTATRYRNSVLGWVWSYVKPGMQFVIYFFVMGLILQFHRDMEYFPIYLFSGIVIVNLFNEAFGNATTAIVDNRALVRKIYLPRELFPVAAIVGAFIHFLPQLAILLVICLILGWTPTLMALVAVLGAFVFVGALALGLGLFFAGLNVRFRDAQNFVEIIRMVSTWASPVLYTWTLVKDAMPDWIFFIYLCNPITIAVELFHYGFWARIVPDDAEHPPPGFPPDFLLHAVIAAVFCLVMLVIGQAVFRRFERTFAQDL